MNRKIAVTGLLAGLIGAVIGGLVSTSLLQSASEPGSAAAAQPLYWVSPMDPTYRRDGPGLSPMGMELVPVYEDSGSGGDSPGTVAISPVVENNLGVRTAEVEVGPFESTIRTVGYVQFDEDQLINIHPRVEGWIERLYAKAEGDIIADGQPLYSLYSPTLVNAQEELLLSMERGNELFVNSAEERLLALQVPRPLIDEIKRARRVFRDVTVYAPQGGFVANLDIREGQFVQPGNEILSIGVLDEVWVIAEVFERQVSLVTPGDQVNMTLDYLPGREWQGVVDYVYPTLDELTRTVKVRLRFTNPGHELKPNMFAQISILHSEEAEQVLQVPHEAVIRTGTQDRVVLALGDGKYKSVEVALGRLGDSRVEVLRGLVVGDRVVTSAHFLLDSESSISSDFLRMSEPADMDMDMSTDHGMDNHVHSESLDQGTTAADFAAEDAIAGELVSATGVVEHVMIAEGLISITHDPVAEWQWPAMTMTFESGEQVDLNSLETGIRYGFQMNRLSGNRIVVTELRVLSQN